MYDVDIREPLFDYLDETYGKNRILEEKTMGRSRADVIMLIEYEFIGLEIKSDSDTYSRLKRQARDYNQYCDRNFIVIGKSHEKHVQEHIPKEWGVIRAAWEEGQISVRQLREALPNPKVKLERQLEWMWRPELNRILEQNALPAYKRKSKRFVQEKLLEKVLPNLLKKQMCEELFERDYTLWEEQLQAYRQEQNRPIQRKVKY